MKSKKILIVEDDIMLSTVFMMFLKDLGYELIGIIKDGKQAIEKCKEILPDLILMDIHLPGEIDGIRTAEIIHQTYDIPIVYISGDTEESTVKRAIQSNSYGYLVKPIHKTSLGITIELSCTKHKYDREIRISEERYRKLIEDSPDAVIVVVNGLIEFINYSGLKLLETIYIENLLQKPINEIVSEDSADILLQKIDYAIKNSKKIESLKVKLKTKYGNIIFAETTGSVIEFKNKKAVQLVIRDITAKIKSEDLLLEQANVIENIHDSVITISLNGVINYCNSGTERLFGLQKKEILGKHFTSIFTGHDEMSIQQKIIEPTLEKEKYETELDFTKKDSKEKNYVHLSLSLLFNIDGILSGIVCYA